ncbi:hypothetical protein [Streptomyces chartreusis]|uniref:hypothetical protein n=1 Tax=Streptomyces chartreusis TaxID=1969 RepID=UPI00123DE4CD|nr:hypothetical protein [Streptomyces chartreusis]QEV66262.1 hypothetical protein CP983_06000 [Streptomyces chartreusis]GGW99050.1 hypothetical protein GCM10010321_11900 [Streptomyces chartreusis]
MARIRTIKPEFFTSLTIADLTPEQRLTFIGLWTHADDAGRCVDDPRLIKAAVWPLDDRTAADIEVDLKALTESSLITRYTLKQKRYIAVTNWREHQRINRPTKSKLPAPDEAERPDPEPPTSRDEDSRTPHGARTEGSPQERKGTGNREQGKEGVPRAEADGQVELVVVDDSDFVGAAEAAPEQLETVTAQTIVAEWIDRCTKRPPGNVIGQASKQIKKLLDEDIHPDDIRAGLSLWMRKGSAPSAIPGFVNQAMNAQPQQFPAAAGAENVLDFPSRPMSTADRRAGAAFDLAAELAAEENQ